MAENNWNPNQDNSNSGFSGNDFNSNQDNSGSGFTGNNFNSNQDNSGSGFTGNNFDWAENNNTNDGRIGPLPANINSFNPVTNADALTISRLIKSGGRVTGYELSSGQQVSREQGVKMAKNGQIKGVAVATNQGTEYLRSFADGTERNNLDSLPSFTQ